MPLQSDLQAADLGLSQQPRGGSATIDDMSLEVGGSGTHSKALQRFQGNITPGGGGARPQPWRALSPDGKAWHLAGTGLPRTVAMRTRRLRRVYERRIRLFSLFFAAPGLIIAIILTFRQNWSADAKWSLALFRVLFFFIFEAVLHDQVIRPLQTLTNVVSSLREEDFSFRARGAVPNDALGELAEEVNALADTLSEQKTFAVEATELLKRVLEEIDTPLFTFDPNGKLKLVNSAGTRLLQQSREDLLGRTADDIGLTAFFQSETGVARSARSIPTPAGWYGAPRSAKRAYRTP